VTAQADDLEDRPQALVAHLAELRSRLLRSLLLVIATTGCLFAFAGDIYTFFSTPLREVLPAGTSMIATEVTSTFFAPFKLTLFAAVTLTTPYLLHQAWSFIAPGLYRHEKRLALQLFASSIVLFYCGMAFAWYVVFPLVFSFFSSIAPEGIAYTPDITDFLNTALKLLLAFGVTFEIPVAVVLMICAGITSAESLTAKRPYIVVGCFVVAAVLTPPDVSSLILMAIPMFALFEAGVFFGGLLQRRNATASCPAAVE
jgi:sec-independent protein translocase protein TatC